ncbi:hypothetical protein [Microbispora sp. CA-102843]|uniref:hypothetical protein n=1 Tax=Microbispora sp. CA-102843 TaxID=3239952 RepID=UPI003D92ABE6
MTLHRTTPWGDHPFELLVGLMAIVGGAASALGVISSTSIYASLPLPVVRAWGALQFVAGTLMVTGILLRYTRRERLLTGWRIERAGLLPLAATAIVYATVVLAYAGTRAIYPAGIYIAAAIACASRARTVARLERVVRGHAEGSDGC